GALAGGWRRLPAVVYKAIVGVGLLYRAIRIFFSAKTADDQPTREPPIAMALLLGGVIGLLSGLTGVGGGIFLSPLLLLMRWAKTKETSAVSVTFILVNSVAGLLGHGLVAHMPAMSQLPHVALVWGPAALC